MQPILDVEEYIKTQNLIEINQKSYIASKTEN